MVGYFRVYTHQRVWTPLNMIEVRNVNSREVVLRNTKIFLANPWAKIITDMNHVGDIQKNGITTDYFLGGITLSPGLIGQRGLDVQMYAIDYGDERRIHISDETDGTLRVSNHKLVCELSDFDGGIFSDKAYSEKEYLFRNGLVRKHPRFAFLKDRPRDGGDTSLDVEVMLGSSKGRKLEDIDWTSLKF